MYFTCEYCGYLINLEPKGNVPPDKCPGCSHVCAFNDATCYVPECGEMNPDPRIMPSVLDGVAAQNRRETRVPLGLRTSATPDSNAPVYEAALIALRKLRDQVKIGDKIKIRKCEAIPALANENAEVVDVQMQLYEKYRTYPVWAKMITGEREGKIYGFREDEIELPHVVHEAPHVSTKLEGRATNRRMLEEVAKILKGITTAEEIAQIEAIIGEVKGKILLEPTSGFWEGKTPCWQMFRCPDDLKKECPAFKDRSLPCWEIEGTYSKLYDYGIKGNSSDICQHCRVYKKWGQNKPIEIKLYGRGFDSICQPLEKEKTK